MQLGPFSKPEYKTILNLCFSLKEGLSGRTRRKMDREVCDSGCQHDSEAPQQPHIKVEKGKEVERSPLGPVSL